MKTLEELAPEIDAGKLAVLVWGNLDTFVFRNQGRYTLSSAAHRRVWTGENMDRVVDLLRCIDDAIDDQNQTFLTGGLEDDFIERRDNKNLRLFQQLIQMPVWTAIDPSMLGVDGVSLLSLRDNLERGETAFCLLDDKEYPYKVEMNQQRGVWFVAPSPMNDVLAEYESLDSLFSCYFRAHLPIWQKGTSPAYQAIEEEYNRNQEVEPNTIPLAFRQAFDGPPAADPREQLVERMKLWGLSNSALPEENLRLANTDFNPFLDDSDDSPW